jgi:hypothetical protein
VGEDQHAAGAGRLDEADRGDRLAGAGRVLEPEAARRARIVRRLLDDLVFVVRGRFRPVLAAPRRGQLLGSSRASSSPSPPRGRRGAGRWLAGRALGRASPFGGRPAARISSVRCRRGVDLVRVELAPSRSFGGSSAAALQAEQQREVRPPLDRGCSRLRRAPQRRVEARAGAVPGRAPRALAVEQEAARGRTRRPLDVGAEGTAARAATSLVLAMKALGSVPRDAARAGGKTWTRMPGVASFPRRSQRPHPANRTYVL